MIIGTKEKSLFKRHTITVGKQAISLGIRNDGNNCPIAKALRLYGCYYPSIDKNWISFCHGGMTYNYQTNPRIRKIIKHYDLTGDMQPFTFYVKL